MSSGVTWACLKDVGNVPMAREALTTCVVAVKMVGAIACSRVVGTGSREHEVGRLPVRSLDTSSSEREANEESGAVICRGIGPGLC